MMDLILVAAACTLATCLLPKPVNKCLHWCCGAWCAIGTIVCLASALVFYVVPNQIKS